MGLFKKIRDKVSDSAKRVRKKVKKGGQSVQRRGKKAIRSSAERLERFRPIATGVGTGILALIPGVGPFIAAGATGVSALSSRFVTGKLSARNQGLSGRAANQFARESAEKALIAGAVGTVTGTATQLIFGSPFAAGGAEQVAPAAGEVAFTDAGQIGGLTGAQATVEVTAADLALADTLAAAGFPAGLGPSGGSLVSAGTAAVTPATAGSAAAAGTLGAFAGGGFFDDVLDALGGVGETVLNTAVNVGSDLVKDRFNVDVQDSPENVFEQVISGLGGGASGTDDIGEPEIEEEEGGGLLRLAIPIGLAIGGALLLRRMKKAA